MARLTYLEAKAHYFTNDDICAGLVPGNTAEFMDDISIGEPPVPQLISIDSGSNVVWVQCPSSTKCFEQTSSIFDPSKSSTYTQLPCSSPNCTINGDKCDPSNNCKFSRRYVGGSIVDGLVRTEKFTFETSDEGISTVRDVFGCASHTDPHYGNAILGDGAKIEGSSTPLISYDDIYYVNLESISPGERRLEIDPKILKRYQYGQGGTVIDSGTTLTLEEDEDGGYEFGGCREKRGG
ncbi:hypothetical protein ACFX1X_022997 [Malus domestica]